MSTKSEQMRELLVRLLLSVAVILPYASLASFQKIYITDDHFTSDIFNAELAGRVLVARQIRHGEIPAWTPDLCSGYPVAGPPAEPPGLLAFIALPAQAALAATVVFLLLVAAHGAYSFSKRVGADRSGAFLAGIAYAGSGVIAAQLKHLSVISTIVWLPVGLTLLDTALTSSPGTRKRRLAVPLFGLVFANQVLAGFPQSVYICALVYAAFVLFRVSEQWRDRLQATLSTAGQILFATVVGSISGALVLWPLRILGDLSDRSLPMGYAWSTETSFWPGYIAMFFAPYHFGDVSNATHLGLFWEFYCYVGLATACLAVLAFVHKDRPRIAVFIKACTIAALLLAAGSFTPVYRVAYAVLPGLSQFRFPTRFLFVAELGVAVLGGLGLRQLTAALAQEQWVSRKTATVIAWAICAATVADLTYHQTRQNPMVDAATWLAPPPTVATLKRDTPKPRTYTVSPEVEHRLTFLEARGWSDLGPYYRLRSLLEPNIGVYWGIPSVDCYAGIGPRWHVEVWGNHLRRNGLVPDLLTLQPDDKAGRIDPVAPTLLRAYGATHVLSRQPLAAEGLTRLPDDSAYIYRVEGSARARIVSSARVVASDEEALQLLSSGTVDPSRTVLLHDVPPDLMPGISPNPSATGEAVIKEEHPRELVIQTRSTGSAQLLLADTFYPGWSADVDERPTPILRANISVRSVSVPEGTHTVRFHFDPPGVRLGLWISSAALAVLMLWTMYAAVAKPSATLV